MNRNLIVVIPDLPENYKANIREAAERNGFDCRFFDEPAQSLPFLKEAEVVVGTDPVLSQNASNLRWLCSPLRAQTGSSPMMPLPIRLHC